jgi:TonB family protein
VRTHKLAIPFISIALWIAVAAGQETQQSIGFEQCKPQAPTATIPFDTCKYLPYAPDIRRAKAVSHPDPTYPESARKAKLNGTVVLAVAVNEQGRVDAVKVVRSSSREFEQNSIDAAKQWVFLPATRDGKPVAIQMDIDMGFRLY